MFCDFCGENRSRSEMAARIDGRLICVRCLNARTSAPARSPVDRMVSAGELAKRALQVLPSETLARNRKNKIKRGLA